MISEQNQLYLVYFNCRGIAQIIRYTLYEIGVPFKELHINPNQQIPNQLKNCKINCRRNLPCILHQGRIIKQLYPIIKYLCYRFDRCELLGKNIKVQSQLIEVFHRFERRKCATLRTIFKNVNNFLKDESKYYETKQNLFKQMKQISLGVEQACFLLYSDTGSYLFGELTILDFVFYEKSFYFTSIFGDYARKKVPIIFAYKNFFQKTQFYQKHKTEIESFKLMMPMFDKSINQGLKKLWVGDKKFISL